MCVRGNRSGDVRALEINNNPGWWCNSKKKNNCPVDLKVWNNPWGMFARRIATVRAPHYC